MPDSVSYNNGGESIGKSSYYSYEIVLNGQKVTSGAKTDSGSFNWHTAAYGGTKSIDNDMLALGFNSTVSNGTLYTYSSNPDYKMEQTMHAFNAISSQKGTIFLHLMSSSGVGNTIEKSLVHQIKGFQDSISVEHLVGKKKPAGIDLNVNGDTDAQWQYYFKSDSGNYSFGQAIIGVMRPSDMNNLTMNGEAAGFPTQQLPYQGINISYQISNASYNKSFDRLNDEINESINQSKGIYSLPDKPNPVYSFDPKNLTNPIYINTTGKSAKSEMFYRMAIQFKVDTS